jgi:hypothetical protein
MKLAKTQPSAQSLKTLPVDTKRRLAFIAGAAVASLALLFLLTDNPRSAPSTRTIRSTAPAQVALLAPRPADTKTLQDYSSLLSRPLFKPLVTGEVKRNSFGATAPRPKGFPLLPAGVGGWNLKAHAPSKIAKSLEKWSYIGTVSVDNTAYALVQSDTGDYGYYHQGESLGPAMIEAVYPDSLVLASAEGETIHLPKTSGAPPAPAPSAQAPAPATDAAPAADASGQSGSSDASNANPDNGGNGGGRRRGGRGGGFNRGNFGGQGGFNPGNFGGGRQRGGGNPNGNGGSAVFGGGFQG